MKLIQLDQLNENVIKDITESFYRLPHTPYKDGRYRLRRYSVVELQTSHLDGRDEITVHPLRHRSFNQSEEYNKHQGGVSRSFEEIESLTLQSEAIREICSAFKRAFDLPDGQEVEIHQLRVITLEEEFKDGTPVAPEGVHRDGFDYIAMVGINRFNIKGGELFLYYSKNEEPFLKCELKSGEIIMLKDNLFWHNASHINKIDKNQEGFGDWFILCAKLK